jgi:hypothetical protein
VKEEREEQLDCRIGGVHLHVRRRVDQRLRVVEDDLHARLDQAIGRVLRCVGRDGQHADHDAAIANDRVELVQRAHEHAAERRPDLPGVGVEGCGDRDAVLGEDRRRGDRRAEATRADERDVVLPLCPQDLADLREQRIDRIPDAALAELAETGEVTADLRRVDVRVFGDLLRRDPLLPHLARLRQHLEVPTQARCDPDPQTFRHDHLRTSL